MENFDPRMDRRELNKFFIWLTSIKHYNSLKEVKTVKRRIMSYLVGLITFIYGVCIWLYTIEWYQFIWIWVCMGLLALLIIFKLGDLVFRDSIRKFLMDREVEFRRQVRDWNCV